MPCRLYRVQTTVLRDLLRKVSLLKFYVIKQNSANVFPNTPVAYPTGKISSFFKDTILNQPLWVKLPGRMRGLCAPTLRSQPMRGP